ncbi:MAG: hypothetical protein M3464_04235 [Chloroflexota bacterium]|nr:hypothetical protein [Chloroflexota bacterium]
MRRFAWLVPVVAVILVGIVALGPPSAASAQEATPAADGHLPETATFERVTFATGIDLMSPADLLVVRIGLESGSEIRVDESDPSIGFFLVQSGTFIVRVGGPITVTRGAGLDEAMATVEATGDLSAVLELVADGDAVTLEAGDAAYIPGSVAWEIRNDGQERATGLAFLIAPAEGMMGEATPVP